MRGLFGFLCVFALGVMPVAGCSETADDGGNGGSAGSRGTGGEGGSAGGLGTFSNAGTCAGGGEVGVDCVYSCIGLLEHFGFEMILNVDPGAVAANSTFEATFGGEALLPDGLWFDGGKGETYISFNHADIEAGATIPVTALSGATGADVVLTMEEFTRDFDAEPEPFVIPILSGSGNFDAGASGTDVCFNFGERVEFQVTVTEHDGELAWFPITFRCQPANQEDLHADWYMPEPEADAGQVCFTIP